MATLTREDIVPVRKKLYEEHIKAIVEPEHIGKYLVIEIETGEFDLDIDPSAASLRAFHKEPEGLRYGMRICHSFVGRLGRRMRAAPASTQKSNLNL